MKKIKIKSKSILPLLEAEDQLSPGTPLCAGCPAEITLRITMKIFGRDTYLFGCASCAGSAIVGQGNQGVTLNPSTLTLMTNVPAVMTGVKRYHKKNGRDVRCVAFVGDGCTVDVGLQPLSGAAERNENLIYICYENEAYMNTGIQRSGSTPLGAWTFTTPASGGLKGKEMPPKYMPLVMLEHNIAYVATANIGYPDDYVAKLQKAMAVKDGLSYIHVLAPCPTGWRYPIDISIQVARAATDTNYWPLWEAEYGRVKITTEIKDPDPVSEFTRLQRRFSHFDDDLLSKFQDFVDERYQRIVHLSKLWKNWKQIK
jgi:pyruvate/2-oxoacid:ferredoxin oxidoreductase beta subunit